MEAETLGSLTTLLQSKSVWHKSIYIGRVRISRHIGTTEGIINQYLKVLSDVTNTAFDHTHTLDAQENTSPPQISNVQ